MVKKPPAKKTQRQKPAPSPSSTAKPKTALPAAAAPSSTVAPQDSRHQQRLLNIFSETFAAVLSAENFSVLLQEIKQALFNRDFALAFGRDDYLEAYAARWSPTRALCYASVLRELAYHLDNVVVSEGVETGDDAGVEAEGHGDDVKRMRGHVRILSVGGCAAEHVAVASYLCQSSLSGHLTLLDSAPWSQVTSRVHGGITIPPKLSKYASAAAKAANSALVEPSQLSVNFTQGDALLLDREGFSRILEWSGPVLVTVLFTLNELYTDGGIGKTTTFLANLGQSLPHGSMLLVLDSPGSYSEAALGKEKKRYPMQWLLDHTLLNGDAGDYKWEKLESSDSTWFRLPDNLDYPIQLENMRYQMHLFRIERKF